MLLGNLSGPHPSSFHKVRGKAAVLVARMPLKWIGFLGPRTLQLFRKLGDRVQKSPVHNKSGSYHLVCLNCASHFDGYFHALSLTFATVQQGRHHQAKFTEEETQVARVT